MVSVAYIIGNGIGLLAPRGDAKVFWAVLLVNASQAAGIFVIAPTVPTAMQEMHPRAPRTSPPSSLMEAR